MKKLIIILLIGSLLAQNNPYTSANEIDNPCEDKIFLELSEKKLDDMSDREYEYFTKKSTECSTYQNTNRAVMPADRLYEIYGKYLWWSLGITIASYIFYTIQIEKINSSYSY